MSEDSKMEFIAFVMGLFDRVFDRDSRKKIPFVFKATIFLSIVLGISFWLLLFSGYRPIVAIFEVDFYLAVGCVSILACIILVSYAMKDIWRTFLYCFMFPTVCLSLLLANVTWSEDVEYHDAPYNLHPQCEIVSPDGQKTFVVQYRIPSDSFVDIWVYYKSSSFFGRNLMNYAHGNFCGAKWLDNNRMLTFDFSNQENNEKVIKEIGLPEFSWIGLIWLFVFYGLLVLCVELLKRSLRILKWLFSTVSKRLQKH